MPPGLRHDIYQNQKLPGDRFVALIECDLRPKFTSPIALAIRQENQAN